MKADNSQNRGSLTKPVNKLIRQTVKIAENKLQKRINYLETHHHFTTPLPHPQQSLQSNPTTPALSACTQLPQSEIQHLSSQYVSPPFTTPQPPPFNLPYNYTASTTAPFNTYPTTPYGSHQAPTCPPQNPNASCNTSASFNHPPHNLPQQHSPTPSNVSAPFNPRPPLPNFPPNNPQFSYYIPQNLNSPSYTQQTPHVYNYTPMTPETFNPPQPAQTPPPNTPITVPSPSNTPFNPAQRPSHAPLLNSSGPIITKDLLLQMHTRHYSAKKALTSPAVIEAHKGLSRVLTSTYEDIEYFAHQLRTCQVAAVEPNWNTIDNQFPTFAISYVQHPPTGRFKFSDQQWKNLHAMVEMLAQAGITRFRIWLDQCLWLRDASQPSWAHSGILPYVLWPVIALGAKRPCGERTADSFVRMWPFVEEISALWGMGLIIASEYRANDMQSGTRSWLSYNLRLRTEPERNLMIVLLNVFHGATDGLQTGWIDDVRELKEMAAANILHETEDIIIGSNWKNRFADIQPLSYSSILRKLKLPRHRKDFDDGVNIYLDGSRRLQSTGWQGLREWFSGNEAPVQPTDKDVRRFYSDEIDEKYNVMTDLGEYQLLRCGSRKEVIWLLVAMQGQSSYFSRGLVAWTKVLTGLSSCTLPDILENENLVALRRALGDQLGNTSLRIMSALKVNSEIEWV